jgi:nitrate reductase molybdenum cofactor assembly chaperone NarJ/NarW
MRSFRVLSRLLTYPQADLLDHMQEMKNVISDEGLLKKGRQKDLFAFMDALAQSDLMAAQESYVELFDRGRAHCLHLFEHVHGESRFRGKAMIDLSMRYREKGLQIDARELPDYLPLFLEFISICDSDEARELLSQATPVIATIGEKLKRRGSDYYSVMAAIVFLSGVKLDKAAIKKAADAALPDIKTLEELDQDWVEPEAFNGAPDCGICKTDALPGAQNTGGV